MQRKFGNQFTRDTQLATTTTTARRIGSEAHIDEDAQERIRRRQLQCLRRQTRLPQRILKTSRAARADSERIRRWQPQCLPQPYLTRSRAAGAESRRPAYNPNPGTAQFKKTVFMNELAWKEDWQEDV